MVGNFKEMLEERKQLLKDMQELHSSGPFDSLKQERWDKMDARYTELDASIADAQRAHSVESRAKALSERVYDAKPSVTRSIGDGRDGKDYREIFVRAMQTGSMAEIRAWTGNHNGTSNAPVPIDMQRRVIELASKAMILRNLATVYPIASDQYVTVDTGAPQGYLVDETNTTTNEYAAPTNSVTETSIAFSRITVGDYAFACRVPVTKWALADYISGGDYLNRRISEGVYVEEENKLINGDASSSSTGNPAQPKGVVKWINSVAGQGYTTTAGASGGGFATIAADDVINVVHKILPRYRRNLNWLVSDNFVKQVRTLKDTTNRYLWQVSDNVPEGLANAYSGQLYGIPVNISEFMPTATAAGSTLGIVGDFSKVEIYDRGPLEFQVDNATGLQKLIVYMQAWKRSDVVVTNTAAFGWLKAL